MDRDQRKEFQDDSSDEEALQVSSNSRTARSTSTAARLKTEAAHSSSKEFKDTSLGFSEQQQVWQPLGEISHQQADVDLLGGSFGSPTFSTHSSLTGGGHGGGRGGDRVIPPVSASASEAPQFIDHSLSSPVPSPRPMQKKSASTLATVPTSILTLAHELAPVAPVPRTATSAQAVESDRLRELGNEQFRLGQFGTAESHYTSALSLLPTDDSPDALIPLRNNRAAARLKNGDAKGCIEDCDAVQNMIPRELKSLNRRAAAFEHLEKWDEALSDYETLLMMDPTAKFVRQNLDRVKGALKKLAHVDKANVVGIDGSFGFGGGGGGGGEGGSGLFQGFDSLQMTSDSKPAVVPRVMTAEVKIAVDKAVENVRLQNKKAELEEDIKFAAKETVDATIERWRSGKEGNLRALLSSLDAVLWTEIGWTKINLSELITPQQVKVKYMKAVAKVHPDKLKASTTVEQRLLASGLFSTLNSAWDTFKEQSQL